MAELTRSDIEELKNDHSLNGKQISAFQALLKGYWEHMNKEDMLSLYRHYGYEASLLEDHLKLNFKKKAV